MFKTTTLLRPILVVFAALSLLFTSCKDDDEPASGAEISFTTDAMTIGEGDGMIDVEIELNKPAPRNFTLTYDVGGTAIEGTTETADFDIQGAFGRVDIDKGETSASIQLAVKQDDTNEGDEVITITLDDVNENGIKIGSEDEITITITDDDDDAPLATVSFVETELTAIESDGLIEIEVTLAEAADTDVTVAYELSGTAQDAETETDETPPSDYIIVSEYGTITIPAGQTSAMIEVGLYSDDQLEDPETLEITLIEDGQVQVGTNDKATLTIAQEDGMWIFMSWPGTEEGTLADMDMFVRIGETSETPSWDGILTASAYRDFDYNYEFVFLPRTFSGDLFDLGYDDTTFGLTYTYYDGTLDPLEFEVAFIEFIDGDFEPLGEEEVFIQTYTAEHKNKWTNTAVPSIIAQTIRLSNGEFSDISPITKEASSSRVNFSNRHNKIIRSGSFRKVRPETFKVSKLFPRLY
ncbi:MAG TPA: Calx-beta domain-containing protein [Ohtaekwangia sp.]|nr:Calx-beta domain-containing protein [Ohtaekwangia sp.]